MGYLHGFMTTRLLSMFFMTCVGGKLHCRISNVSDSSGIMYTVDCSKLDSVPSCDQLPVACESVSKLILKNNTIKELPNGSFKKYTGLKELDISGNPIQQCLNGSFHGLTKLEVLQMTDIFPDTKYFKFQNGTFTPLVSLKSLDMSSSRVHIKSLFPALCSLNPDIEKLILNNIHQDYLSVIMNRKLSYCFSKLNLKHFEFEKNRVMAFTLGGMMNFKNLQYFSVSSNNIVVDRNILWMVAAFHNLTYLDVSCQNFGKCGRIPKQLPWSHYLQGPAVSKSKSVISQVQISPTNPNVSSWYFLSNLHTLNISFNNLEVKIRPFICWKDNHLVTVDLSYSDIIELNFFDCLIFLKYLNLRNIRSLGFHILSFHGCPSLEILMLGSSNLKDKAVFTSNMSSVIFEKNVNLKFLDMSKLGLTTIHKNLFSSLQKLEVLILSQNYITALEGELFSNLTSIQHLDLSNNFMKNIPMSVLTYMEEGLHSMGAKRYLHIGNNPFLCVCSTIPQIQRVLNSKVIIPNTGLQCILIDARTFSFPKALEILKHQCYKLDKVSIVFLTFLYPLVLCMILLSTWSYRNKWNIQYLWYKSINLVKVHEVEPEDNAVFDVFIAYSQHDEEWVRLQLVKRLESERPPYSCCVHDRNFMPGEHIADNIISAISASKKTILVVTKKFVASGWCEFESKAAQCHHLGKRGGIIAVVFPGAYNEAAKRKPGLCGILDCVTYLPWTEDRREQTLFWLKLCIALGRPQLSVQKPKGATSSQTVRLVNM